MQPPLLQKTRPPGTASPVLPAVAAALALVGLADAVWLTVQELTGAVLTCGGSPDCARVLGSPYAWIGAVPVAGFGVPAYFGVFSLGVFAAYGSRRAGQLLVALVAAMCLATLWLLFVQAVLLHAFCRYCLLSASVTFVLAALVLCWRRRAPDRPFPTHLDSTNAHPLAPTMKTRPVLIPLAVLAALAAALGAPPARAQADLSSRAGLDTPLRMTLGTAAPGVTYANLVTNPSFETGDFTGYTVASPTGTVAVVHAEAHSGSYAVVFGNTHDYFDTISQTLTTVPGTAYTVSFWLESYNNTPTADDAFTAKFGGTTLLSEHNVGTIPYTQYSYNVVATGSSTVLSFAGYNAPNDDYLDDLSVTALPVPEPATWAGGALLVGAAGLALRRRVVPPA